jgi:hypothetical protein
MFGVQSPSGQYLTPAYPESPGDITTATWSWQPTPVYPFNARELADGMAELARYGITGEMTPDVKVVTKPSKLALDEVKSEETLHDRRWSLG